jgi:hypothetical protein
LKNQCNTKILIPHAMNFQLTRMNFEWSESYISMFIIKSLYAIQA